jgi:hypothetical protein
MGVEGAELLEDFGDEGIGEFGDLVEEAVGVLVKEVDGWDAGLGHEKILTESGGMDYLVHMRCPDEES